MERKLLNLVLGLGMISVLGSAQAALVDLGGGMIYDNVLKNTWLQDANYAKTSGYDGDGRMRWTEANTWANNLSYGGFDDWRLPTMVDTRSPGCDGARPGNDCGYNVQTVDTSTDPDTVYSEMAYMYYVNLGLKAPVNPDDSSPDNSFISEWGIFGNASYNGIDLSSFGQNDVGLIDNLQAYNYWSGLESAADTDNAWLFFMGDGGQVPDLKALEVYAWAVRSDDVATVPEPSTLLLLGLAMAGLGAIRRRG